MHGSLFWIEWLDRLDRVLSSARHDVANLARAISPRSLEAMERSKRQLAALNNDLRLLATDVLAPDSAESVPNAAENLQRTLEFTVTQLARIAELPPGTAAAVRDRVLAAIDSALRDSRYEAAMLLAPGRRAVAAAASARA